MSKKKSRANRRARQLKAQSWKSNATMRHVLRQHSKVTLQSVDNTGMSSGWQKTQSRTSEELFLCLVSRRLILSLFTDT